MMKSSRPRTHKGGSGGGLEREPQATARWPGEPDPTAEDDGIDDFNLPQ